MKVATLDDYLNAELGMADWSGVSKRAGITVITDAIVDMLGFALGGHIGPAKRS